MHASLVLPHEEALIDEADLQMMKDLNKNVVLEIGGVSIYKGKNGKLIFALKVYSPMMLNMRWNLGLEKKPKSLNLHISLFEKF